MAPHFTHSRAPLKTVNHVQFGILSPDETVAMSVAKIEHVEMFDGLGKKEGGLLDPRMGCVDKTDRCTTCRTGTEGCPGHFGHIELARPFYHIGWQMIRVKKILETFCHHCSKIRLTPTVTQVVHVKGEAQTSKTGPRDKYLEMMKIRKAARFTFAWRYGKGRPVCEWADCGRQLLPLKRVRTKLQYDNGKVLEASDAHEILRRISDDDWTLLGMDCVNARPEWMILTVLPVPPPAVRPSINMEGNGRGEDDLTHKLGDIIKYNELVKNPSDGSSSKAALEHIELLQYHITTYIDNAVPGNDAATQKGGRPLKSLKSRLKGKEGRFRNNLMGKRVDHSARTVITGDPNLRMDQVGVPQTIAQNLTVPEMACDLNVDQLQRFVDNRGGYPGAKYLIHEGGRRDLRFGSADATVQIGDTVERHLIDGDIVVFNRQPSLHKMSMMGHRVKVMSHSTFRLNLSVTTPYNADFDGDEMNLHVPQSWQTRAEIAHLATVPQLIVSPQSNRPVCGIVQDALLGIYLLTARDRFLDRETIMDIAMHLPDGSGLVIDFRSLPPPAIIKPVELWTGKQMFSMLLPKTLSYSGYHSAHPEGERTDNSPGDTKVIIRAGELLSGIICKRAIGPTGGGLVHLLWQDDGPDVVQNFMNGCQCIANQFLVRTGFSVAIGDGMVNKSGLERVTETVRSAGQMLDDNMTRDTAGRVAQSALNWNNNFRRMVAAGSKGSSINISQIAACVGPQNVEGKGIPRGFRNRTLPHFREFENSPSARGFVMNSYSRGLNPSEFFFHAMGGREGIIDTAVKTSETGYLQRKLVKALEDLMVAYDALVRNGRGNVIQWRYGEDGMDGTAIEKQSLLTILLTNQEIMDGFASGTEETEQLIKDRDRLREVIPKMQDSVALPANVRRILSQAAARYPIAQEHPVQNCREKLHDLLTKLGRCGLDYDSVFAIHIRSVLATRQLMRYKISDSAFSWIMVEVCKKYQQGLVHPGEMVGVVAAQSIGEPATQLTLNSVDYTTELLLDVDGHLRRSSIGDLVERAFKHAPKDQIETHPNNTFLAWIREKNVRILSCDEHGQVTWRAVEAVTKHPVVNRDGSNTLLKVTTQSGRSVVATKAKSFLKRVMNKIVPVDGEDLKVGDYLPVSGILPTDGLAVQSIDVRLALSAADSPVNAPILKRIAHRIPQSINLDRNFGWICGVHLASGECTIHHIMMINNDDAFSARVTNFLSTWDLGLGFDETIRINDVLMACMFLDVFGVSKRIPSKLLAGPVDFHKGLLEGYIDSIGCITPQDNVTVDCVSRELLDDIQQVLLRLNIHSSIQELSQSKMLRLVVPTAPLTQMLELTVYLKNVRLHAVHDDDDDDEDDDDDDDAVQCHVDIVPDVVTEQWGPLTLSRQELANLKPSNAADAAIIDDVLKETIVYDRIVAIEEVSSHYPYVYDLTVEGTRTFNTYQGLAMYDTFHLAGVGSKKLTLGIPRLKELLNTSQNIRTPSMTLYTSPGYLDGITDERKAGRLRYLKSEIEHVALENIVDSIRIIKDGAFAQGTTDVQEDKEWVELFLAIPDDQNPDWSEVSPWMLRIVLDRTKIWSHCLTMKTVVEAIKRDVGDDVWCIGSDDNDEKLVVHFHLIDEDDINGKIVDDEFMPMDTYLRQLQDQLLCGVTLKGLRGITGVSLEKQTVPKCRPDGSIEYVKETVIETEGINISEICGLPDVDGLRTTCNSPVEVLQFLGIEAARAVLLKEIRKVIEFDGSYINVRHLMLLVDTMTTSGSLMAITRHGINRTDAGPLAKSSFEETNDILFNAAADSDRDSMQGISESLIFGQMARLGTGSFDIVERLL